MDKNTKNELKGNEFTVTDKLRKIQVIELDLFKKFDQVCKKYSIKYSLWGGTLLGAIRHKGFIPWDDDLDVCLTREEYSKLIKIAPLEFSHPYFFQNCYTDKKFFFGYSRLRNSTTTGIIKWNYSPEYNNGIYMDIYVLDGLSNETDKIKKQINTCKFYQALIDGYYVDIENKSIWKKIIYGIYRNTFCKIVDTSCLIEKYNKIITKYNSSSNKLSHITHNVEITSKYWCYKKDLEEMKYVSFCDTIAPIPSNYDEILKNMYGEYMKYPPTKERGEWHNDIIIFDPDHSYKEYFAKHK